MEKEWRIKLAKAEQDFNETLVKNRKAWEREEEAHRARQEEMRKENETLEIKRIELLVPFDIIKESTDGRFEDAKTFMVNLREREANAEELTERLEEKLDEVGEREQSVQRFETALTLKEKGLNSQIESVKTQSEGLTAQITQFLANKQDSEKGLTERENALKLRENSVKAAEEGLVGKEIDLRARERRLADEREVLQRAWDEFRRMKNKSTL